MTIQIKKIGGTELITDQGNQTENIPSMAGTLANYICPVVERVRRSSAAGKSIADWFWDHDFLFGFDMESELSVETKKGVRKCKRRYNKALPEHPWNKLVDKIKTLCSHQQSTVIIENTDKISHLLGLDALDTQIFRLIALADADSDFESLLENIVKTRSFDVAGLIAIMLGAERLIVQDRLSRATLAQLGLVEGYQESMGSYDIYVPWRIMDAVQMPSANDNDIQRKLLGVPLKTDLTWSDFNHMRKERDFANKLLGGAQQSNANGVNILLYGDSGLGKTEFAKLLAQKGGLDLYAAGERASNGGEPDRDDRLYSLRVVERLTSRRGNAVILFDEMEDLLGESRPTRNRKNRSGSKVHLNRILENNRVPTIWITNSIDEFDTAFLRRMRFIIEFKTPSANIRTKQWRRLSAYHGLDLEEEKVSTLAKQHKLPVSFADSALRAVTDADARTDEIDLVLNNLSNACYGKSKAPERPSCKDFNLELVNADCDLEKIYTSLCSKKTPRDVSFCLYGPPGTGKSALASYFADAMELDVLEKRSSDLLSSYVGESEQRVARAFEEAADEKRMLIIDEAESLFWSREGATKSWEASIVNEFLVGLERSPVPVVCTTNHLDRMDKAALRRFVFKVRMGFLHQRQMAAIFEEVFGEQAPAALLKCDMLTPGDFAVVKRQLRFQAKYQHPDHIVQLLKNEIQLKRLNSKRIGF